jgi:hypothetical protein
MLGQARMIIRPAFFENPQSEPGAPADIAFRSKASLWSIESRSRFIPTSRHRQSVAACLKLFDRDESTMFRLPKSDTRCRRTLFIHGYEEPYCVK